MNINYKLIWSDLVKFYILIVRPSLLVGGGGGGAHPNSYTRELIRGTHMEGASRLQAHRQGGACVRPPPFLTEISKQQYTTVGKVVSLRQSPIEFKVIGHPLA